MTKSAKKTAKKAVKPSLPPAHDWRTTDTDEINKRRQRAREESFVITNATPAHPIFSNFRVQSASGLTYSVEVRSLAARQFACSAWTSVSTGWACASTSRRSCSSLRRATSDSSRPRSPPARIASK